MSLCYFMASSQYKERSDAVSSGHVGPKPGLGRFPNKQMFDVPAEEPECHLFLQNLLHSFVTSWLNVNKYQFSIYA